MTLQELKERKRGDAEFRRQVGNSVGGSGKREGAGPGTQRISPGSWSTGGSEVSSYPLSHHFGLTLARSHQMQRLAEEDEDSNPRCRAVLSLLTQ